ncbi:MAG: radical SAM protein [Betaproteobacteria bacterium]
MRADERAVTASAGSGDQAEVVAWDGGGRLYSVWRAGHTWRRGLSGRALHKWHDATGRHRERIGGAAVDRLLDETASLAGEIGRIAGDGLQAVPGHEAAVQYLARAARFDAAAGRADAARFHAVYRDVGILPPDQYLSTVVELTEGCTHDTCTFCDLYNRPFRVRGEAEFARHLREVREYLGESLPLRRRSVFLGAANALALSTRRLESALDAVGEAFESGTRVSGFLDAERGSGRNEREYRSLAARGLDRVYVGVESGHDRLLAFVRKPGTSADAVRAVRAIKSAGVRIGLIVLIGLGGDRFAEGHVADTIRMLNDVPLDGEDIVYFSELVEGASPYASIAAASGIRPLSPVERRAQTRRIRDGLSFAAAPPRMARYDVRDFVY